MIAGARSGRPRCRRARPGRPLGVPVGLVAVLATLAAVALALPGCRSVHDEVELAWETPRTGQVVAEHPLAVEAGVAILEDGGNAADAAVAAALTLAVVYPQAGNVGGGGFAIWVAHDGDSEAYDFRETAPSSSAPEFYMDSDGNVDPMRSRRGPLAVGVPGTPAGLAELYGERSSGRFTLRELAAPAMRLAREGFEIDAWTAKALADDGVRARMATSPAAVETFYPGGEPLADGDRLVQPDLAETLRRFSDLGPDGFYRGIVARRIEDTLRRAAGFGDEDARSRGWVSRGDLSRYRVRERRPLRGWFRGMEVITMPPPSSGGLVVLEVLSILEGYPLSAQGLEVDVPPTLGSERLVVDEMTLHGWIEALRVAFADRAAHMGDPEFHEVPIAELMDPRRIAACRLGIGRRANPDVRAWELPQGPPPLSEPERQPVGAFEGGETTHVSVLDADGNAVSMTLTMNMLFGSGLMVEGAGFLLNNQLDDFAIAPGAPNVYGLVGGAANAIEPGKRPLSSMTPVVVRDGGHTVSLVLGSPGGPKIITAVLGVLLRVLAFDQTLEEAVLAPRVHQQWRPAVTLLEPGWDADLVARLRRRGHEIEVVEKPWASIQAISVERGGTPVGVSDPRRGGIAGTPGEPLPERKGDPAVAPP